MTLPIRLELLIAIHGSPDSGDLTATISRCRVEGSLDPPPPPGSIPWLVEWIRCRGGVASVQQLQRSHRRLFPQAELARERLKGLVEAGLAERAYEPVHRQGGRPRERYRLLGAGEVAP